MKVKIAVLGSVNGQHEGKKWHNVQFAMKKEPETDKVSVEGLEVFEAFVNDESYVKYVSNDIVELEKYGKLKYRDAEVYYFKKDARYAVKF